MSTSQSVAPNAVKLGKHDNMATETIAIAMIALAIPPDAKCSLQCAPIVARKLKYRLNHVRADLCIAVIAFVK